jgi:hypothetical protein
LVVGRLIICEELHAPEPTAVERST